VSRHVLGALIRGQSGNSRSPPRAQPPTSLASAGPALRLPRRMVQNQRPRFMPVRCPGAARPLAMRSAILAPDRSRDNSCDAVKGFDPPAMTGLAPMDIYHGYNRRRCGQGPPFSPFVPSCILKLNRSEFLTHQRARQIGRALVQSPGFRQFVKMPASYVARRMDARKPHRDARSLPVNVRRANHAAIVFFLNRDRRAMPESGSQRPCQPYAKPSPSTNALATASGRPWGPSKPFARPVGLCVG